MTATIDMTAISARHTSAASGARTRQRYWAQIRLQAYGILALTLAAAALVILLWTVVAKTATVLFEDYLVLDVQIDVSNRDLTALNDPDPRINVALNGVVRDGLRAEIGGGDGLGRREVRQLFNLVSTDAGLELGAIVKRSVQEGAPLIGARYRYEALLDDQVQMYLGGLYGRPVDAGSDSALSVTRDGEDTSRAVLSFEGGAFEAAREALRTRRAEQAARAEAEAARQQAAVEATEARIAALGADTDTETVERLRAGLDVYARAREKALENARALMAQASDRTTVHSLSESDPSVLVRVQGGWIKLDALGPDLARGTILAGEPDVVATAPASSWQGWLYETPETNRNISDRQVVWLAEFEREGKIVTKPNWRLLESSDSSNAELAGIWGALVGSFWTMVVTFLLAFPIGVMASIYLEEFAPKNAFTDFIEININNLAAVPSIVFGLLGITVLISGVSLFGVDLFDGLLKAIIEDPRSTPVAGGVVLALMSLPTIIIAGRASIKAVPPSIRDAALGLGASRLQTATHHVLPLAMPGMMTGSIIAMAQALGETAPLIIIGMNSFIQEAPSAPGDKANVLPSLIYIWKNNSERLFDGKTAAAICVLLVFLIAMNALAVLLRKRFERRW
ncbi:MAG: phosphate ABC transporter permease PstA [Pseudomonadota bacterium]